jgi:hypothetical protein
MVVFSGFYESHEPPPSGDASGIVPLHCHGHQNDQQRGGAFCWHMVLLFCWQFVLLFVLRSLAFFCQAEH